MKKYLPWIILAAGFLGLVGIVALKAQLSKFYGEDISFYVTVSLAILLAVSIMLANKKLL